MPEPEHHGRTCPAPGASGGRAVSGRLPFGGMHRVPGYRSFRLVHQWRAAGLQREAVRLLRASARLPSGLAGTGIGLLSIAAGPALIASGSVVFVLALILLVPGVTFGCRGFGGCGLFGFGFFIVGFFGCCSGLVL